MTKSLRDKGLKKSSRSYKYVHASEHLDRWVKLFSSGGLQEVYKISCEAKQLTDESNTLKMSWDGKQAVS